MPSPLVSDVCSDLGLIFVPSWPQHGPTLGRQIATKFAENSTWTPKGRQEDPRSLWKSILDPLGDDFVPSMGRFGTSQGMIFFAMFDPPVNDSVSRVSLPPSPLPPVYLPGFLPLLLPWRPRFPGSAGARVSAYNFSGAFLFSLISIYRNVRTRSFRF